MNRQYDFRTTFRPTNDFKTEAYELWPEPAEKGKERILHNIEHWSAQVANGQQSQAELVTIVTTHGMHVDVSARQSRPRWCNYCAVTMLKISSDGTADQVLNCHEDHVTHLL